MDFKDLTYITAIAKYQNITKAANSLYITQPTLTKFLQNFEKDLGQKIFSRLGNRFLLTYAGEIYLKKATEILKLKRELDQEMLDLINNHQGCLKLAFPTMRGTYMLPCTLPVFNQRYPNVKITLLEAHSSLLENMLMSGEADIAFFNLTEKNPSIEYEIISHEEVLLLLSSNHPLTKHACSKKNCKYPWLDLNLLKNEPFILQSPGQRTRAVVDRLFKYYHFTPNIILETVNIPAAVELACMGYGACFVTETHLKHIPLTQLPACFSIGTPSTTVNFAAAFRKNCYLPSYTKDYIQIVRDFT